MQEALNAEETFFAKHPAYSALAREQGIPFLSHRLNQILEDHIRPQMPEIRKKVKYVPQVLFIVLFIVTFT
jgi:dynamin 1-like protein